MPIILEIQTFILSFLGYDRVSDISITLSVKIYAYGKSKSFVVKFQMLLLSNFETFLLTAME